MRRLPGETREEMADRWIDGQPARLAARAELSRSRRIFDAVVAVVVLSLIVAVAGAAAILVGWVLFVGVFEVWTRLVFFAGFAIVLFAGSYLTRHR